MERGISTPLPINYQKLLQIAENEEIDKSNFPYRNIVGSLMYAMLGTRPDLATAVSVVSKYLDKPKPTHVKLVQHILKYLQTNQNYKLKFQNYGSVILTGYADAGYANDDNYVKIRILLFTWKFINFMVFWKSISCGTIVS